MPETNMYSSKYRYIFLFVFIALFAKAYSQSEYYVRTLSFGVSGGVTGSQISFVPTVRESFLFGYNAGVTARYIPEKHFGIQGELNLAQRGWKEKPAEYTYSRVQNYIELPVLSHIYFGRKLRFFVNLGPQIAYFLNEKVESSLSDVSTLPQARDVKNKFDYSIVGGGGFEFHTSLFSYQLEGRYNFGLGNLFPSSRGNDFLRSAHRNISINFTLLYNIGLR